MDNSAKGSNGRRRTDEEALVETLVKLVAAGEEGILTRQFRETIPVEGFLVIKTTDADELVVGKVLFACLERLESRGLAVRHVLKRSRTERGGVHTEEKFVRTEQALVALYNGDPHTVAEVEEVFA